LAHEIGHYKKKHTLQMLVFSVIQTWFILYIFSFFIDNKEVALALWSDTDSFHIWAIAFSILFTPLSLFLGILWNVISRKNEYEADNFVKVNYDWKELINWLKKLSVNNLSNLLPHKVYEFVHYSHPTVLKRIKKLKD
jgi:STE24 endopeptidase